MGGKMDVQTLVIWLLVGAIAGWLAKLGIVIGAGFVAAIINAFIGAVILLLGLRLVKRAA